MAYSKREQIIQNRVTLLATITEANGYDNTVAAVSRNLEDLMTCENTPKLFVVAGAENSEWLTNTHIRHKFLLRVIIAARGADDNGAGALSMQLESLRKDLLKAWYTDIQCGNPTFCELSGYIGGSTGFEWGNRRGYFPMDFLIQYRHATTEP